jgi:hypothetical protein
MKRELAVVCLAVAGTASGSIALAPAAPAGRVVHSATGSGHRMSGATPEFRSFSFHAVKYADGSARGEAQVYPRSLDAFAHIRIDCLSVNGDVAHMSGVITHTSDPSVFAPAEHVHFAVEDNGEGDGAPADRITGIPENDPGTCTGPLPDPADAPFRPIIAGNVQVR